MFSETCNMISDGHNGSFYNEANILKRFNVDPIFFASYL